MGIIQIKKGDMMNKLNKTELRLMRTLHNVSIDEAKRRFIKDERGRLYTRIPYTRTVHTPKHIKVSYRVIWPFF